VNQQRTLIAAQWADAIRDAAKARMKAAGKEGGRGHAKINLQAKSPEGLPSTKNTNVTRQAIAERAQVSDHPTYRRRLPQKLIASRSDCDIRIAGR
jgi:hypothetical protein